MSLSFDIVSLAGAFYQLMATDNVAKISLSRFERYADRFGCQFKLLGGKLICQCQIKLLFTRFHGLDGQRSIITGSQQRVIDESRVRHQAVDDGHGRLEVIISTGEGLLLCVCKMSIFKVA